MKWYQLLHSMDEETDFLWRCALFTDHSHRHELQDITPDRNDSPTQFFESVFDPLSLEIENNAKYNIVETLEVMVREIREYGVLDTIGGEVWEASIILSSYFLLYPTKLNNFQTFLELGCGVGLPSLVLCNMLLKNRCVKKHVIVSDNDARILNNMVNIVKAQFTTSHILLESSVNNIQFHVLPIDWNDFRDENFDLKFLPSSDSLFLYGAALCYSPYHYVLADMINSLIKKHNLKEIIILQISDRVGFDKFLNRLHYFGIAYNLESIPQECYDYAKYVVKSEKCLDDLVTKIYSFPYVLPLHIDYENPNIVLSTPRDSFVMVKCRL